MKAFTFTISWLYGEFKVQRLRHGSVQASWTADFLVCDINDLKLALEQACQAIDFHKGGDLCVVYESDNHSHELLALPQMSKKDLNKYLARKVEQLKPFEGDAAWCYHDAKRSSDEEDILLHLLPQDIVDVIVDACQEFGLRPKYLLPLSEVVSALMPSYELAEDEFMVVVALFKQRTDILVSTANGDIIFIRSLSYCGFDDSCERLVVDVNRTLRYAKQQFRQSIKKVCLSGENITGLTEALASQIEAEVIADSNSADPYFWATNTAKLNHQSSANYISVLAQRQINKTLLQRLLFASTPVLACASFSTLFYVESSLLALEHNIPALQQQVRAIKSDISFYDKLSQEVEGKQQKLNILQASSQNLPALLLNNMAQMLPQGLVLTQLSVEQQDQAWQLDLVASTSLDLNSAESVMHEFENKMRSPPWNLSIENSWQRKLYNELKSGGYDLNKGFVFEVSARVN